MLNAALGNEKRCSGKSPSLLTFVLWMSGFHEASDGLSDLLIEGFVSVILTIFTFWIIGICLAFLLIPLRIFINLLRAIFR